MKTDSFVIIEPKEIVFSIRFIKAVRCTLSTLRGREIRIMFDVMVNLVQQPAVPLIVLCVAGVAVVFEALRVSREALWSDLFDE